MPTTASGANGGTPVIPIRRGRGRPPTVIDWSIFDALCQVQCTKQEIAAYFRCSEDAVERAVRREKRTTFSAYYNQHAGIGKMSLRRKQFQMALNGNVTMLIWLGKQTLGQADQSKVKQEVTGAEGGALEVNVDDVRERVTGRVASIAARIASGGSAARA
jgi:hypothetical protein